MFACDISEHVSNKIKDNLFSFYSVVAERACLFRNSENGFSYIYNHRMNWPAFILGNGKISEAIIQKIKSGELPSVWIQVQNKVPEDNGFIWIDTWKGMHMRKTNEYDNIPTVKGYIFEEFRDIKNIEDWLAVINEETDEGQSLKPDIFRFLMNDPDFRFFRVTDGKRTIATLLVFIKDSVCGIYLVSTLFEKRNKGIGTWITSASINKMIEEGCTDFVLHSTSSGFSIYSKLGFNEYCNFDIYRLF